MAVLEALMPGPSRSTPPDPDRAWRKLTRHKLWPDIEIRLRHKWSPHRVVEWLDQDYPKEERPSAATMYRYLRTRDPEWYVTPLIVAKTTQARLARLLVVEEHAELLNVLKGRLQKSLALEETISGGQGFISPVVSHAMELLSRLLETHLKIQQSLGLVPKVSPPASRGTGAGGEDDAGDDRGFLEFVQGVKELPQEQFFALVQQALGAPGRAENIIETTAVDVTPEPPEEAEPAQEAPPDAQATIPGL